MNRLIILSLFLILLTPIIVKSQVVWQDWVYRSEFYPLVEKTDSLEIRLNTKTQDLMTGCTPLKPGKPGFVPGCLAGQMNYLLTGSGNFLPISQIAEIPPIVTFGPSFIRDQGQPYVRYSTAGTYIVAYFCLPFKANQRTKGFIFRVCAQLNSTSTSSHFVELFDLTNNAVVARLDFRTYTSMTMLTTDVAFKTLIASDIILAIRAIVPSTQARTFTIYFANIEGVYNYD